MYNVLYMLHNIKVLAPAKINLSLKVLPKRDDGYHDIESIFQSISLYDELLIEKMHEKNKCYVSVDSMELPEKNTITKAYDAFVKKTGIDNGIKVFLKKVIPSGAGLGGGSADAGALIRALNTMFEAKLTYEECVEIALNVGSDVPFFLCGGISVEDYENNFSAVVTGRGDVIKKIPSRTDLFYVLICPDVHSSTPEAYGLVDENPGLKMDNDCPGVAFLEEMFHDDVKSWRFSNSFTEVLSRKYPDIRKALEDLKDNGAEYVQMSGSGSSVFGVFTKLEEAKKTQKMLNKKWKRCFILPSS